MSIKKILSVFILELQSLSSHISEWREEQLKLIYEQIRQRIESIQSPPKDLCQSLDKFDCRALIMALDHKFTLS